VVAVPANAAGHVEQQVRHELQNRADLGGDDLGRVEVAGVQRVQDAAGQRVGQHELVGAHGVALDAQPEELGFHRVLFHIHLARGKNRVQRLQHARPGRGGVGGHVLISVWHPEVDGGGLAQRLSERRGDLAAALAVLDPEVPDAFVRAGQCEAALGLRVREVGRVEVEAQPPLLGPAEPVLEVFDGVGVPVHSAVALFGVIGVQVQLFATRDELQRLIEVGAQFVAVSGATGVIARGGDATGSAAGGAFTAEYIVSLPAVHRNRDLGTQLHRIVDIDTMILINLARVFKALGYQFTVHRATSTVYFQFIIPNGPSKVKA